MTGKGTPKPKIATNEAAEIAHIAGCLSTFFPILHTAAQTTAITAALSP